jgi:hypothetical protein
LQALISGGEVYLDYDLGTDGDEETLEDDTEGNEELEKAFEEELEEKQVSPKRAAKKTKSTSDGKSVCISVRFTSIDESAEDTFPNTSMLECTTDEYLVDDANEIDEKYVTNALYELLPDTENIDTSKYKFSVEIENVYDSSTDNYDYYVEVSVKVERVYTETTSVTARYYINGSSDYTEKELDVPGDYDLTDMDGRDNLHDYLTSDDGTEFLQDALDFETTPEITSVSLDESGVVAVACRLSAATKETVSWYMNCSIPGKGGFGMPGTPVEVGTVIDKQWLLDAVRDELVSEGIDPNIYCSVTSDTALPFTVTDEFDIKFTLVEREKHNVSILYILGYGNNVTVTTTIHDTFDATEDWLLEQYQNVYGYENTLNITNISGYYKNITADTVDIVVMANAVEAAKVPVEFTFSSMSGISGFRTCTVDVPVGAVLNLDYLNKIYSDNFKGYTIDAVERVSDNLNNSGRGSKYITVTSETNSIYVNYHQEVAPVKTTYTLTLNVQYRGQEYTTSVDIPIIKEEDKTPYASVTREVVTEAIVNNLSNELPDDFDINNVKLSDDTGSWANYQMYEDNTKDIILTDLADVSVTIKYIDAVTDAVLYTAPAQTYKEGSELTVSDLQTLANSLYEQTTYPYDNSYKYRFTVYAFEYEDYLYREDGAATISTGETEVTVYVQDVVTRHYVTFDGISWGDGAVGFARFLLEEGQTITADWVKQCATEIIEQHDDLDIADFNLDNISYDDKLAKYIGYEVTAVSDYDISIGVATVPRNALTVPVVLMDGTHCGDLSFTVNKGDSITESDIIVAYYETYGYDKTITIKDLPETLSNIQNNDDIYVNVSLAETAPVSFTLNVSLDYTNYKELTYTDVKIPYLSQDIIKDLLKNDERLREDYSIDKYAFGSDMVYVSDADRNNYELYSSSGTAPVANGGVYSVNSFGSTILRTNTLSLNITVIDNSGKNPEYTQNSFVVYYNNQLTESLLRSVVSSKYGSYASNIKCDDLDKYGREFTDGQKVIVHYTSEQAYTTYLCYRNGEYVSTTSYGYPDGYEVTKADIEEFFNVDLSNYNVKVYSYIDSSTMGKDNTESSGTYLGTTATVKASDSAQYYKFVFEEISYKDVTVKFVSEDGERMQSVDLTSIETGTAVTEGWLKEVYEGKYGTDNTLVINSFDCTEITSDTEYITVNCEVHKPLNITFHLKTSQGYTKTADETVKIPYNTTYGFSGMRQLLSEAFPDYAIVDLIYIEDASGKKTWLEDDETITFTTDGEYKFTADYERRAYATVVFHDNSGVQEDITTSVSGYGSDTLTEYAVLEALWSETKCTVDAQDITCDVLADNPTYKSISGTTIDAYYTSISTTRKSMQVAVDGDGFDTGYLFGMAYPVGCTVTKAIVSGLVRSDGERSDIDSYDINTYTIYNNYSDLENNTNGIEHEMPYVVGANDKEYIRFNTTKPSHNLTVNYYYAVGLEDYEFSRSIVVTHKEGTYLNDSYFESLYESVDPDYNISMFDCEANYTIRTEDGELDLYFFKEDAKKYTVNITYSNGDTLDSPTYGLETSLKKNLVVTPELLKDIFNEQNTYRLLVASLGDTMSVSDGHGIYTLSSYTITDSDADISISGTLVADENENRIPDELEYVYAEYKITDSTMLTDGETYDIKLPYLASLHSLPTPTDENAPNLAATPEGMKFVWEEVEGSVDTRVFEGRFIALNTTTVIFYDEDGEELARYTFQESTADGADNKVYYKNMEELIRSLSTEALTLTDYKIDHFTFDGEDSEAYNAFDIGDYNTVKVKMFEDANDDYIPDSQQMVYVTFIDALHSKLIAGVNVFAAPYGDPYVVVPTIDDSDVDDYKFGGWVDTDGNEVTAKQVEALAANIGYEQAYTAIWLAHHEVTYVNEYDHSYDITISYWGDPEDGMPEPDTTPLRDGYKFTGWKQSETDAFTYIAQWTKAETQRPTTGSSSSGGSSRDSSSEVSTPSLSESEVVENAVTIVYRDGNRISVKLSELPDADSISYAWTKSESGEWQLSNNTVDPDATYYFTGWYYDTTDTNWYFLDGSTAKLATGWNFINNKWYYLNPDASRPTYIQDANGNWVYDASTSAVAKPYGSMYANEQTPDGYWVDADGAWVK